MSNLCLRELKLLSDERRINKFKEVREDFYIKLSYTGMECLLISIFLWFKSKKVENNVPKFLILVFKRNFL